MFICGLFELQIESLYDRMGLKGFWRSGNSKIEGVAYISYFGKEALKRVEDRWKS